MNFLKNPTEDDTDEELWQNKLNEIIVIPNYKKYVRPVPVELN